MDNTENTRRSARMRMALKFGLLIAAGVALYLGGRWVGTEVETRYMPLHERYGDIVLAAVIAIYVMLMATPFVPGIEISLALLMIFGIDKLAVVYFSTWAALLFSYFIGSRIPPRSIGRLLGWLHLRRAEALVRRLAPLSPEEKLSVLVEAAPARIVPFLLRHRYIAVAIAFNLPGNALIGGGGGIALAAGLSGLFRLSRYALMVGIAISPIPLFMLVNTYFWQSG